VPYRKGGVKYAQFQMGYKGYIQLALRTGQYQNLNVCEVFEGELVKYDKLKGEVVIDPAKRAPSGGIIGYATYLRLTTGFEHSEFWTVDEVKEHAERYSQSYRSAKKFGDKDAPWVAKFDAMAFKTVLSMHIRKWGPMSVQSHLFKALGADQGVKRVIDAEIEFPDNPSEKAESPKFDGPPELEPEYANAGEVDQVPGAEMATPAEGAFAANVTPKAEPDSAPALEKPLESLLALIGKAGFTESQVLEYCLHLRLAKKEQKLSDLAEAKLKALCQNWNTHKDAIQKRIAQPQNQ
jgi:recombinational DNA repair protein RecT